MLVYPHTNVTNRCRFCVLWDTNRKNVKSGVHGRIWYEMTLFSNEVGDICRTSNKLIGNDNLGMWIDLSNFNLINWDKL